MRTIGLNHSGGMENTQWRRALKLTRKVSVMEEIKDGFQRVPFMVENNLAGRTPPLLLPPANECPQGFRSNLLLYRMLQAWNHWSAQEDVESSHLLGNQVVGNDGYAVRATGDLARLPCMP